MKLYRPHIITIGYVITLSLLTGYSSDITLHPLPSYGYLEEKKGHCPATESMEKRVIVSLCDCEFGYLGGNSSLYTVVTRY